MPQRANNHTSLQRTYQEDRRVLASLVKQLEEDKLRTRQQVKSKKCQRGIQTAKTIASTGMGHERIDIALSYAATSQVYHDPFGIDEAQEKEGLFLRSLRMLIHEISETLGIIMTFCNIVFGAYQIYWIFHGGMSISRLLIQVIQPASILPLFAANMFIGGTIDLLHFLVGHGTFIEILVDRANQLSRSNPNDATDFVQALEASFFCWLMNIFSICVMVLCHICDIPFMLAYRTILVGIRGQSRLIGGIRIRGLEVGGYFEESCASDIWDWNWKPIYRRLWSISCTMYRWAR